MVIPVRSHMRKGRRVTAHSREHPGWKTAEARIARQYEGKKVPKKYQKEYGKRYTRAEARIAARRILGANTER